MEFPSIAAHGSTKRIALTEIKKVINASIKWLEEENKPIPEPLNELENGWNAARPAKRTANEQLVMSN
jgi:predicted RNase H-like HicB family nuclease